MFFVGEEDKPIDRKDKKTLAERHFLFDLDREDYMLSWSMSWESISTEFFTVKIGGKLFNIPSGMYILCGCAGGSHDWMLIDEVVGRPIEIFTLSKNFRMWSLSDIELVGYGEDTCYVPLGLKQPFPVMDSTGSKIVILSQYDLYHKMKDKPYDLFCVN